MSNQVEELIVSVPACEQSPREPVCKDYDEDCESLTNHLHCWLHDMGQGRCPYVTGEKP